MPRTVWFPGHMARGSRKLEELAGFLDLLLEVRDARAPRLCASPFLEGFRGRAPVWTILSKADLACPEVTKKWIDALSWDGRKVWAFDLRKDRLNLLVKAIKTLKPSYREVRLAVVGLPNVGKSLLLNGLVGRKATPVGAIPGVTRGVSWFRGEGVLAVDSPGILDPRADARVHRMLAWIGCTRKEVISQPEVLALECLQFLRQKGLLEKVLHSWELEEPEALEELLMSIGRRLGRLSPGGKVDRGAAAKAFLEAFSSGKFGRMSLEMPEDPPPWEFLP